MVVRVRAFVRLVSSVPRERNNVGCRFEAGAAVATVLGERLGWSPDRRDADLDDLDREVREHAVAGAA